MEDIILNREDFEEVSKAYQKAIKSPSVHIDSTGMALPREMFIAGAKWMLSKFEKIGNTKIELEDDGCAEDFNEISWLDLSATEYAIPEDKFSNGDEVEVYLKRKNKAEILVIYRDPETFGIWAETRKEMLDHCFIIRKYDKKHALDIYANTMCTWSTLLKEDADVEAFCNEALDHILEHDIDWLEKNFT